MAPALDYALALQAQPLPLLVAGAALLVALALLVHRVLTNALPGRAPPVDEGIPFVGGLIKFSKVRGSWLWLAGSVGAPAAAPPPPLGRRLSTCPLLTPLLFTPPPRARCR